MHPFVLGLIVGLIIILWLNIHCAGKLDKDLDDIFKQAQAAKSTQELQDISTTLHAYAEKHCGHYHPKVREIMAYIHGRIGDAPAIVKHGGNAPEIVVEKRYDDWKAYLRSEPGCWGNGTTWSAAIGQLVDIWPEKFNIKITYPKELEPKG